MENCFGNGLKKMATAFPAVKPKGAFPITILFARPTALALCIPGASSSFRGHGHISLIYTNRQFYRLLFVTVNHWAFMVFAVVREFRLFQWFWWFCGYYEMCFIVFYIWLKWNRFFVKSF